VTEKRKQLDNRLGREDQQELNERALLNLLEEQREQERKKERQVVAVKQGIDNKRSEKAMLNQAS
jgi:hypothetical protein